MRCGDTPPLALNERDGRVGGVRPTIETEINAGGLLKCSKLKDGLDWPRRSLGRRLLGASGRGGNNYYDKARIQ